MELEPGFKLSEAGPIPEDWNVATVGAFDPFVTSGSRGWAKHYASMGDLFVRITNMVRDNVRLDLSDVRYVAPPASDAEARRTALKYLDVLVSITADIGIVSIVTEDVPLPAYVNQHVAAVRFDDNVVDPRYVAYFLKTSAVTSWFRSITDAGAKAGINLDTVRGTPFAEPALEEQRAISAALADTDAWIAEAETEAEKLASVKAAAMDALLTPTTRLPGFSGQWCPVRIGDLYDPLSTVAVARAAYVHSDGVACIHYGDIHVRYDGFVRIGHDNVAAVPAGLVRSATRLMSGDVLIADAAEDLEGVGKAVELIAPANLQVVGGLHVQALRPKTGKLALGFAGYLFRQAAYRDSVERAASGLKVYGISKSQLRELEVVLPPTLEEQQAITAVLSDIDAALAAARAVVAKARNVKAAAMDSLLSGRVRLPGFRPAARRASADALEAA